MGWLRKTIARSIGSVSALAVAKRAERRAARAEQHCDVIGSLADDLSESIEAIVDRIRLIEGLLPEPQIANLRELRSQLGTLQAIAANHRVSLRQIREAGEKLALRVAALESHVVQLRKRASDDVTLRPDLDTLVKRLDELDGRFASRTEMMGAPSTN